MPTSHPWNPNDESITLEDRERGYRTWPCRTHSGPECDWCDGSGNQREPVREYRPDKKIRAVAWLPHGEVHILFWDNKTLTNFAEKVRRSDKYTEVVRGWDHADYHIRPSAVTMFRRIDPHV